MTDHHNFLEINKSFGCKVIHITMTFCKEGVLRTDTKDVQSFQHLITQFKVKISIFKLRKGIMQDYS